MWFQVDHSSQAINHPWSPYPNPSPSLFEGQRDGFYCLGVNGLKAEGIRVVHKRDLHLHQGRVWVSAKVRARVKGLCRLSSVRVGVKVRVMESVTGGGELFPLIVQQCNRHSLTE